MAASGSSSCKEKGPITVSLSLYLKYIGGQFEWSLPSQIPDRKDSSERALSCINVYFI